jgi:hypothetical protein
VVYGKGRLGRRSLSFLYCEIYGRMEEKLYVGKKNNTRECVKVIEPMDQFTNQGLIINQQ